MGAAKGLTTSIGDLIADLIEPLAKIEPESTEEQSIEELLKRIQEVNKILKKVATSENQVTGPHW